MSQRPGPVRSTVRVRASSIAGRLTGGMSPGTFARGVLVLAAGGAIGQAVALAASPVITRLYLPVDVGTLSVYTSLLSMLTVVVSLRFEQAIPMPAHHDVGRDLLAVALTANLAVSLLTTVGVLLLGDRVAVWTQTPALMPWLWLLPFSLAALGAFEALSLWAVRIRAFSTIARGKVTQNICQVAAQIALGVAGLGPAGLMAGDVGSRIVAGATLARLLTWRAPLLRGVTLPGMRAAATRYRRFAGVSSLSGVVNATVGNLPPLLLAALYGPAVAGLFALGRLVIFAPIGLLGQSIARVYLSRVTRLRHEAPATLPALLGRVTARLLLSLPAFAILFLAAPTGFPLVFGSSWAEVGTYTQLLCPALALDFVFLTTNALTALGLVGRMLAWDAIRMVASLGGLLGAHALGAEPRTAILVYSMALSLSYVLLFAMNVVAVRRRWVSSGPASG